MDKLTNDPSDIESAGLTAAINSLSLGFIFFDAGKSLITKNDTVGQIFGTSVDSFNDVAKLIPAAAIASVCDRSIASKMPVELKNIKFGDKYLRIMTQPIFENSNRAGGLIGFVLLIEDTTHARIAEKTKDEFFTMASHELRTPLTVIRGNISMIRRHFAAEMAGNKDLAKMVDDTYRASVGLIRMVNDFLNIATLDQKGMLFKKEKVDIPALTAEIVAELSPLAKMKDLFLDFLAPKGTVQKVSADKEKTKEILFNIISNAINYTDSGGITVSIAPVDGKIEVLVEDTGSGIPTESQLRLFERFQHSKEEVMVRDTTKGTGLGLYISRLLAEGMGGELNLVRSKEGVGSVFSFVLPA